jgi:hypothetical protein
MLYRINKTRKVKNLGTPKESTEQAKLFTWAKLQSASCPDLGLMFAIPNGGTRNIIEAVNLKRQGVRSGVPDLFLPVARGDKHGLFIEMKIKGNKPSDNQKVWAFELKQNDYAVETCYGFDEAKAVVCAYLDV